LFIYAWCENFWIPKEPEKITKSAEKWDQKKGTDLFFGIIVEVTGEDEDRNGLLSL